MSLVQSIEHAREDRIGQGGVSARAYDDALPLLKYPAATVDLPAITEAATARPTS